MVLKISPKKVAKGHCTQPLTTALLITGQMAMTGVQYMVTQ